MIINILADNVCTVASKMPTENKDVFFTGILICCYPLQTIKLNVLQVSVILERKKCYKFDFYFDSSFFKLLSPAKHQLYRVCNGL